MPGSPYVCDSAYETLCWARENHQPLLGSCGGFQYAVIEYARNVWGWQDANHTETDSEGRVW
ncbi:CTP synthase|nr:CTP synthase [Candidatus Pantoea persica]